MTTIRSLDSLGAASNGSPIDWSELLARHQRWLRTVVLSRLGGTDGLEEVLQNVALAAVRQRAPLADAAKAAPWLYRLAVVQSLLYRRTRGRQRKLIDRVSRLQPPDNELQEGDPLSWLLADERHRLVREALDRLPSRDREVLLLKYTEGWSYRELADHLGITTSAVEARLHRARGRLRGELASVNIIEVEP